MSNERNKGWNVVFAALFINLSIGGLYAWSVFKAAIKQFIEEGTVFNVLGKEVQFTWDIAALNDPYAWACVIMSAGLLAAGRLQDKKGPGITALIGGIMAGIGLIMASYSTNYWVWFIGFGVLFGTGIGFAYSAGSPAALKWFNKAKSGTVAGIVVSGFGSAPIYVAPLADFLIKKYDIFVATRVFGVIALVVITLLSIFILKNPPEGYVAPITDKEKEKLAKKSAAHSHDVVEDFKPIEVIKTPALYILWILFFIGAGAGLLVIGSMTEMAKKQMGTFAFLAVIILAMGNATGRIMGGVISDKIGRIATLFIMFIFQAIMMFTAIFVTGIKEVSLVPAILVVTLTVLIGFNYGTNMSLFPSFTKDLWGMKNFGVNYGLVYSAWGVGGFVFSRISQMLFKASSTEVALRNFNGSFILAGVMLILGLGLIVLLKKMKPHH